MNKFLLFLTIIISINGQDITDCRYFWQKGLNPPVEITESPEDKEDGNLVIKCTEKEDLQDAVRILQILTGAEK